LQPVAGHAVQVDVQGRQAALALDMAAFGPRLRDLNLEGRVRLPGAVAIFGAPPAAFRRGDAAQIGW
jgi:hypothetical protein